jgi:hypothetical protein
MGAGAGKRVVRVLFTMAQELNAGAMSTRLDQVSRSIPKGRAGRFEKCRDTRRKKRRALLVRV